MMTGLQIVKISQGYFHFALWSSFRVWMAQGKKTIHVSDSPDFIVIWYNTHTVLWLRCQKMHEHC